VQLLDHETTRSNSKKPSSNVNMTTTTTTTTTSSTANQLRQLFRDTEAVKIYPDDFIKNDGGTVETNIIFPDLVDRHKGHFSDRRLVVLFRPGSYTNINFPVGYWTQVLGLGETPQQVTFTGNLGVYALPANTDNPHVGSLDTFWRSAENFQMNTSFIPNKHGQWCVPTIASSPGTEDAHSLIPSKTTGNFSSLYPLPDLAQSFPNEASNYDPSRGMLWAVSQAAPLRRIHVGGNLHLSLGNNCASGGFMSNVNVDQGGYLMMGSQQQFCVRNCDISEKVFGGAWSMVFNGCRSDLNTASGASNKTIKDDDDDDSIAWVGKAPLVSSEPTTRVRAEKPFICLGTEDGKVYLAIPQFQIHSQGTDHHRPPQKVEIDNLKKVRVVTPHDSFSQVQAAADVGAHLVLSPGIYNWGETLEIRHSNQVMLGLGLATIQAPGTGRPCIHVTSQAQGVRLSGLSLEATVISKFVYEGSTLLEWGDVDSPKMGTPDNPGAMHDLYCFVGGRSPDRTVQVQTMVKIHSSHVMGDNIWLWRADHVKLMNEQESPNRPELSEYHVTTFGECRCDTGLEVIGDHVTFYGLAIEHTYRDMLIWHGKHGAVHFYQSEMPYDVPGEAYEQVAGYRVYPTAHHHIAKGIGVYSYFREHDNVVVDSAVAHHASDGEYENVFAVWLNGYSGIRSILNGDGGDTTMPGRPFSIASYQGPGVLSRHFWKGMWKKYIG
jgi:hypothetical protein